MSTHKNHTGCQKVGIVILNYNTPELTFECVKTILHVEDYPNFEIAVVDNCSPDATGTLYLKDNLPPSVIFISSKENGGYSSGNNLGARFLIEERLCKFIFILNSDAFLENPTLGKVLVNFQDPGLAALSPIIIKETEKGYWRSTNQVRRLFSFPKMLVVNSMLLSHLPGFSKWSGQYIYKDYWPWKEDIFYKTDTINGAAFMIRADFFEKYGYLDEKVFLYNEELILGMNIKSVNMQCGLDTSVRIIHHQGVSTNAGNKTFPIPMYKHLLHSFEYLFVHYYHANKTMVRAYSYLKWVEYYIKNILRWTK